MVPGYSNIIVRLAGFLMGLAMGKMGKTGVIKVYLLKNLHKHIGCRHIKIGGA